MEADFPTRLRECRKKAGLNQEDAARQIGIAYSTYRRYEQGGTVPDLLTASKLASERAEKAIATCSAEIYVHGELAATGDVTLAMR